MTCRDCHIPRRWLTEYGQIPEDRLQGQIPAYDKPELARPRNIFYLPSPACTSLYVLSSASWPAATRSAFTAYTLPHRITLIHAPVTPGQRLSVLVLYYFCISVCTKYAEIRELWNWIWWGMDIFRKLYLLTTLFACHMATDRDKIKQGFIL